MITVLTRRIILVIIHARQLAVDTDHGIADDQAMQFSRRNEGNATNLVPGILSMVDEGRIALTPAVELSYLTEAEQKDLLETMESEDCTPSLSQAIQLKQLSQAGKLDIDTIFGILTQPKANQREKISFRTDEVRKFFPKNYTPAQMQEVILKLLGEYQRKRQRSQER